MTVAYQFPISSFPLQKVDPTSLAAEIERSPISIALNHIEVGNEAGSTMDRDGAVAPRVRARGAIAATAVCRSPN